MRILFLTPQFPYPPHKGTTLRNYNLIAGLAARHEIDLLCIRGQRRRARFTARSTLPPHRHRADSSASQLAARAGHAALAVAGHGAAFVVERSSQQRLTAWLSDGAYDVIQVEGIELARYALTSYPGPPPS